MATLFTQDSSLTAVANAIRTKGGTSAQLTYPNGFVQAINDIETGGGGYEYFYTEGVEAGTIKISATGTVDVALQYSTDKTN